MFSLISLQKLNFKLNKNNKFIFKYFTTLNNSSHTSLTTNISINILEIKLNGEKNKLKMSFKDIKKEYGIYSRDIISLGLIQTSKTSLNLIKKNVVMLTPRNNCIISSIGSIKLLIYSNKIIVFEYDTIITQLWLQQLTFERFNNLNSNNNNNNTTVNNTNVNNTNEINNTTPFTNIENNNNNIDNNNLTINSLYNNESFELFIIEDLFVYLCNQFDRRILLYNSLMKNIFEEIENSNNSPRNVLHFSLFNSLFTSQKRRQKLSQENSENIIYKLSPLNNILHEFELEIKEYRDTFQELLRNDEDMSRILLTAREKAIQTNQIYNIELHEEIELILENYVLKLTHHFNEIVHLQHQIKTTVQLSDLTMKIQRNRILWLNVNLTSTGICLSFISCIVGAFGMNLVSGLENIPYLFYGINSVTLLITGFIYIRLLHFLYGVSPYSEEKKELFNYKLIENIVLNHNFVDLMMQKSLKIINDSHNRKLTKPEFIKIFEEVRRDLHLEETIRQIHNNNNNNNPNSLHDQSKDSTQNQFTNILQHQITEKEMNLLFELMDKNNDGNWNEHELLKKTQS